MSNKTWVKKMDDILEENGLTCKDLFVSAPGDNTSSIGDNQSSVEDYAKDFCTMWPTITWDSIVVTPESKQD